MTITVEPAAEVATKDPRELVEPEMFHVMVDDLVEFDKVTRPYAERGVEQFLVFMKAWGDAIDAVGGDPSKWVKFAPSPAVDKVWHRSMMRTRNFAAVCDMVAGRFMHHLPIMDEDIRTGAASERGMTAMRHRLPAGSGMVAGRRVLLPGELRATAADHLTPQGAIDAQPVGRPAERAPGGHPGPHRPHQPDRAGADRQPCRHRRHTPHR